MANVDEKFLMSRSYLKLLVRDYVNAVTLHAKSRKPADDDWRKKDMVLCRRRLNRYIDKHTAED